MNEKMFKTPIKTKTKDKLVIPPSPYLKTLGYGTGVCVYEFIRSPLAKELRSPWAIKKIIHKKLRDAELKKRLNSEAEILRKLNHPNIIGFRAFIKSPKGDILAMEECTTSLGDLIEEKRDNEVEMKPYPPNIILRVGHDISCALNYLHNVALLLHCDIKSFNVLVKNDFKIIKLCDFGVSLPLKKDGTVDELKAGDEVEYVGTPAWSAPEVLKFPQEITTKADVYSFGIVLYEMITLSIPVNEEILDSIDDEENRLNCSLFEDNQFVLPNIDIGIDYNFILELMHVCASIKKDDRPAAHDLEAIFKEMLNQK